MRTLRRGLVFVEETIPAILLVLLVSSVTYGVVARYVFDTPQTWVRDFAAALIVWQVFLASAGAARRHMHLGVDAVVSLLPGRWRAAQEILVNCALLVVLGFFIYLAWTFSLSTTKVLEMINLSFTWIYSAVPVGFGLVAVHIVANVTRGVRGLLSGDYEPPQSSVEAFVEVPTEKITAVGAP